MYENDKMSLKRDTHVANVRHKCFLSSFSAGIDMKFCEWKESSRATNFVASFEILFNWPNSF